MNWYIIYPRFDDWKIYSNDDDYKKSVCHNKKCHRVIFSNNIHLASYPKLKKDFLGLSSMNI
jgi:hypothetical protein